MLRDLLPRLDLLSALNAVAPNDLLPPREDDRAKAQVGERFIEHLRKQIKHGQYEPARASFVPVPKPGFTSRPAALLTLTDRVLYEALVDLLRPQLANYILGSNVVLWPREKYIPQRWRDFERVPLETRHNYVVQADISGFYESIDHAQLEDDLVQATGEREIASAIHQFLQRVMGNRRGVPQGLLPSDTLATAFLQPVDAAIIREGFEYWRHGDDMRASVETISRARAFIALVEEELRHHCLLINASKVMTPTRDQYASELNSGDLTIQAIAAELVEQNIEKARSSDDELIDAMKRASLDERWGWDLFYHNSVSLDEVIQELKPKLKPSDVELAEQVLTQFIPRAPGAVDAIPKELFNFLITRSFINLTAGCSPAALPHAALLIAKFPEKTNLICKYLMALLKTHPAESVAQAENLVISSLFLTPWQQAWLFRVLESGSGHVSASATSELRALAASDTTHWLARVEAMKVLAKVRQLDRVLVSQSWKGAPRQYRTDLLVAAAHLRERETWAQRFLDAATADPVEQVVARDLQAKS